MRKPWKSKKITPVKSQLQTASPEDLDTTVKEEHCGD
jgi:hypothetical protein